MNISVHVTESFGEHFTVMKSLHSQAVHNSEVLHTVYWRSPTYCLLARLIVKLQAAKRAATILFSAYAALATIRGRLLFEGGYHSRTYGNYFCSPNLLSYFNFLRKYSKLILI